MQDPFKEIPWHIKATGTLLASGASVAVDHLHLWDGPYGLLAGIALAIWFCLDVTWHLVNKWRISHTLPALTLEPNHIIALGFVIVAAGFVWRAIYQPSTTTAPRHERHLTEDERKRLLAELTPEAHEFKLIHDYGISIFAADTESMQYADEFATVFREAKIPCRDPQPIVLRRTDLTGIIVAASIGNNLEMGPARSLTLALRRAKYEVKLREIPLPDSPGQTVPYSLYALVIGPNAEK